MFNCISNGDETGDELPHLDGIYFMVGACSTSYT